jgi:hypothetical protein
MNMNKIIKMLLGVSLLTLSPGISGEERSPIEARIQERLAKRSADTDFWIVGNQDNSTFEFREGVFLDQLHWGQDFENVPEALLGEWVNGDQAMEGVLGTYLSARAYLSNFEQEMRNSLEEGLDSDSIFRDSMVYIKDPSSAVGDVLERLKKLPIEIQCAIENAKNCHMLINTEMAYSYAFLDEIRFNAQFNITAIARHSFLIDMVSKNIVRYTNQSLLGEERQNMVNQWGHIPWFCEIKDENNPWDCGIRLRGANDGVPKKFVVDQIHFVNVRNQEILTLNGYLVHRPVCVDNGKFDVIGSIKFLRDYCQQKGIGNIAVPDLDWIQTMMNCYEVPGVFQCPEDGMEYIVSGIKRVYGENNGSILGIKNESGETIPGKIYRFSSNLFKAMLGSSVLVAAAGIVDSATKTHILNCALRKSFDFWGVRGAFVTGAALLLLNGGRYLWTHRDQIGKGLKYCAMKMRDLGKSAMNKLASVIWTSELDPEGAYDMANKFQLLPIDQANEFQLLPIDHQYEQMLTQMEADFKTRMRNLDRHFDNGEGMTEEEYDYYFFIAKKRKRLEEFLARVDLELRTRWDEVQSKFEQEKVTEKDYQLLYTIRQAEEKFYATFRDKVCELSDACWSELGYARIKGDIKRNKEDFKRLASAFERECQRGIGLIEIIYQKVWEQAEEKATGDILARTRGFFEFSGDPNGDFVLSL